MNESNNLINEQMWQCPEINHAPIPAAMPLYISVHTPQAFLLMVENISRYCCIVSIGA